MPKPQCPECHKTFARKSTMELHMESVHLEVKHKCSICDKDFSTKGSLNRHINDVHEANRTFKCPECPLKFARQDTLDRHVNSAKANWRLHGVALICHCGKDFDYPSHNAAMTLDCQGRPLSHPSSCKSKARG